MSLNLRKVDRDSLDTEFDRQQMDLSQDKCSMWWLEMVFTYKKHRRKYSMICQFRYWEELIFMFVSLYLLKVNLSNDVFEMMHYEFWKDTIVLIA